MRLQLRLLLLCGIAVPVAAAAQSSPGSQSAADKARAAVEKAERDRTPQVLRDTFGEEVRCSAGMSASECAKRKNDAAQARSQRFRNPAVGRSYGGAKQGAVALSPDQLLQKFNDALAAGNVAAADQYMNQYRKLLDGAAQANLTGLSRALNASAAGPTGNGGSTGNGALDKYIARHLDLERQMSAATTQGQLDRLGKLDDENSEAMQQAVMAQGRAAIAAHGVDPSLLDGAPGRSAPLDGIRTPSRVGAKPKIIEVRRARVPKKKAAPGWSTEDDDDLIGPLVDRPIAPATKPVGKQPEQVAEEKRALQKKMRDARADYDRILAERDAGRAGKGGAGWADADGISARRAAVEQAQLEYEDFLRDNAPGELKSWQQSTGRVEKPGRWGSNDRILINAREKADAAYDDYVRAVEGQRAKPSADNAAWAKAMEARFVAARADYDQAVKQVAPERYNRDVRERQNPGAATELRPGMTRDPAPASPRLKDYDGPAGTGPSNAPGVANAPSLKDGMTEREAELYDRMVGLEQQYEAAVHDMAVDERRETASQVQRRDEIGKAYAEAKKAFQKAQRERP